MKEQRLVNKRTLAKDFLGGVSVRTVENLVSKGTIKLIRVGRRAMFAPDEVIADLKQATTENDETRKTL